jgi:hypothetical protein
MQPLQLPARFNAELFDEQRSDSLVRPQGLTLAVGPVLGEHELAPKALTQWMYGDEGPELDNRIAMVAQRQIRF